MTIGQIIVIVGAGWMALWAIRTAVTWSAAGIKGAVQGLAAAFLVLGVLSFTAVPAVDWIYSRFRVQLPATQVVKDAEGVAGTIIDIFGEKPQAGWLAAPEEGGQPFEIPWGGGVQPTPAPGVQPTSVPGVQATPVPKVQVPQAVQPQPQLIEDPAERAKCWREAALQKGLQSATSGGASWFPAGTPCSMEWGLGFLWGKDRFWVTCLDLGLQRLEITKELGGQLAKLVGTSGGTFYGTGNWPPACYIEVAPVAPVAPSPTTAPIQPTATPLPVVVPTPTPGSAFVPQPSPTPVLQTGTAGSSCANGAIWSQMCNPGGPLVCVVRGTCQQVTP